MLEDNNLFVGLENFQSLNIVTQKENSLKEWSMVVIKDTTPINDRRSEEDDFAVFPPSNHENLIPSCFISPETPVPGSPPSPATPSSCSYSDNSSSPPSVPEVKPVVSRVSGWWDFAFRILKSKVMGSCEGEGERGKRQVFWSYRKVGLVAATVVTWWWVARAWRLRRRRNRERHLMEIIREKDEKIMQLLKQIVEMNEVLLTRHKALISK